MFECNLGILLACGPAIRQFWAYRTRTHSSLPTKYRQQPNEDFEKMRYRVNVRDIFWYRKAQMVGSKVFDASPIFRSNSPPPEHSSGDPQESSQVSNSALDWWEKRIKKVFSTGHEHKAARHPSSETTNSTPSDVSEKEESPKTFRQGDISSKKPHTGRKWGLFSPKSESSTGSSKRGLFSPQSEGSAGSSNQPTFLLSATEAGTRTTTATQDGYESFWPLPSRESETADELSNPRMEPIHGSQIV
ncbi:hypothetical protein MMC18_002734 [Xylographa bjoerkii]|nr:hypothetical protein [Xylographa bjoerkii]